MPSFSSAQAGLFRAALACKLGKGKCKKKAAEIARSMSVEKIKEFFRVKKT